MDPTATALLAQAGDATEVGQLLAIEAQLFDHAATLPEAEAAAIRVIAAHVPAMFIPALAINNLRMAMAPLRQQLEGRGSGLE